MAGEWKRIKPAVLLGVAVVAFLGVLALWRTDDNGILPMTARSTGYVPPATNRRTERVETERHASDPSKAPLPPVRSPREKFRADEPSLDDHDEDEPPDDSCLTSVGGHCGFLTVSRELALEMARCGIVRYDYPEWLMKTEPIVLSLAMLEELNPAEKELVKHQSERFRSSFMERFKDQFRELGGDPDAVANMEELQHQMYPLMDLDEAEEIQREIARRRAGMEPAVRLEHESATANALRSLLDVGDDYEKSLAQVIGAQKARALREADDGWGVKNIVEQRCPPQSEEEPE